MRTQTESQAQPSGLIDYFFLKNALKRFEQPPHTLTLVKRMQAEQDAYDELRLQQLVLESPESASVTVPEESVDQAMITIRRRFADTREFEEHLVENNLNQEDFLQAVARELKVDALLEHVGQQTPAVEDHRVGEYYQSHLDSFVLPETRTAQHILITINPDYAENTKERAYKRIVEIEEALRRSPELFGKQAARHSECPSALNEGSLGTVSRGKLLASLDQVLFEMNAYEISTILESELGYHLLRCEEIHPSRAMTFHEAEPLIRKKLEAAAGKRFVRNWLQQLDQG